MKALFVASIIALAGAVSAQSQEAGQEYSPGEREQLAQAPIPGAEGQTLTIQRVTFPGGWTGDRHEHAGPVHVYVLDGSLKVQVDGAEEKVLSTGDFTAEPMNQPMVARNESDAEPVTILLIQVSAEGAPIMTTTE